MSPRFHVAQPLAAGAEIELPPTAARHVQVLRLQPGAAITLFNGLGGQWKARVLRMGRSSVQVVCEDHQPGEAELPLAVTLALGMPANERMDTLVEKAAELGAAAIVPLVCERSVLRLDGERALRRAAHWQAVAVAACEQCGRNRVPGVAAPQPLSAWLAGLGETGGEGETRWVLSLSPQADMPLPPAMPWARHAAGMQPGLTLLSGPEGGLSTQEEAWARARGFAPRSLGPRVLRADTAPLAVLAWLGLALAAGAARTQNA